MEGIQQGRLWAVRLNSNSPIFHVAETGLPTLFRHRKEADAFKKRVDQIDPEHPTNTEVVHTTPHDLGMIALEQEIEKALGM